MVFRLFIIALAAAALLAPPPASFVERGYSSSLFPRLQPIVTGASNQTTIAWFDVLIVFAVAAFVILGAADLRRRRVPLALGRIVLRFATFAAVAYLAFLAMWGLNYQRQPLREKVRFDASRITTAAAATLARETVSQVNALHADAHRQGWPGALEVDRALVESLRAAAATLRLPATVLPGRPKRSLLDFYFRRAGVAGMTDPFFLETMVASDILPFERPHVVAHEWAHLAGVTDEGEANFVSWLACVRGLTSHRYSGWLFLYREVTGGLPPDVVRQVGAGLADGPRADLRAIRERYEREVNPRIAGAGWQVYDSYLKANRVEAGTASYGEVVRLVLGTGLR